MRLILRFLSSLWLGLVLIALMTVSCIVGSMIASNESMGVDHAREYVFHTWWFLGIMGLLLVNLALCSWEKSYIALTLYKKKNFIENPAFYEKAGHALALPWNGSIERLGEILRRKYTVVHNRGAAFYAQRGLFGRCGATIIHIGLLWTMAAGYYRILADDFGWGVYDSTVIIPEGESTQTFYSRIDRLQPSTEANLRERKLPFTLRELDFRAEYHPNSTVARHFSSLVEVKDGDHTQISEVTMQQPMLYRGYKITQNSFSDHDRILRGKYRVTNTATGDAEELDAIAGDPVKIKVGERPNLFLQLSGEQPEQRFQIVDLANRKIIESGAVEAVHRHMHSQEDDHSTFSEQLANSRYAILIAALFPNFRLDENNQPTTQDDKFGNPAVLVMLFKKGEPNGYTWLFLHEEAKKIMGHQHPELEMDFVQYRRSAEAGGAGGLYDFEVEVRVVQKTPRKELGTFWLKAGTVKELEGVDQAILDAPPVVIEKSPHGEGANPHGGAADPHGGMLNPHGEMPNPHDAMSTQSGTGTSPSPRGGAAQPAPAAGGNPRQNQFHVAYLGTVTGQVTYLGFMRDPSVAWLFSGVMVIIFGTLVAFMITYRECWVYYNEATGMLYMATNVRGSSPGAHREFDRNANEIIAAGEVLELETARS